MNKFILSNGVELPAMGIGTTVFASNKNSLSNRINQLIFIKKINYALNRNYSSFDSSAAYGNERLLGVAGKLSNKSRKDLFYVTKLSNLQQRTTTVSEAIESSLRLLQTDYIDLYLMHWPNPETYLECWKQMEELYYNGKVRAIGVCNFHQHHLEKLLSIAEVVPHLNQFELHPLLTQQPLVKFCENLNIQVQSYTPLARLDERLFKNNPIKMIAEKYNKTPQQIVLRWHYENGYATIPRSLNYLHMKANSDIFDFALTEDEKESISEMNINCRLRYNPDNCDYTKL